MSDWFGSQQALDCVPWLLGAMLALHILGVALRYRIMILRERIEGMNQK